MILPLLLAAVLLPSPQWQQHTQAPTITFPRDHGAHPQFRTEWWYLTAECRSAAGQRYGVQLTIFRQGMQAGVPGPGEPRWKLRQAYAGHLAIAALDEGRFVHAERVRRANGGLAGASEETLDVWIEDWSFALDAQGVLRAKARDGQTGIAVDLSWRPTKPAVLHGDRGLSLKGPEPGNASAYMSWTRLEGQGTLEWNGQQLDVTSSAWFDHEWGSSQLGAGVVGWDWFGLRLVDGRELMIYLLRRSDGTAIEQSGGTLVLADGSTRTLRRDEITLEALEHWTSPRTKGRYPSRWRLSVPSTGIDGEVRAQLEDCELDTAGSSQVIYWEGPVSLKGSTTGSGYAELTGYAGSLGGRF
jgi:predicted secreted hydrolase